MSDSGVISFPVPDQGARARIAADLESNLLVEAGAGSGKTRELVQRMVALVESGTATVEQIAAVTFTRKAAAELRERFQTALEARIAARVAQGEDADVLERLRAALDDIDRVFVGTIHAFCARLLRERPLEIGLDPAFEELPVEERIVVRRRFWEAYLERLTRDADPALEELAAAGLAPSKLYSLFDRLVENADVTFPADAVRAPSGPELAAVRAELDAIVDHAWELMPERQPPRDWDSLQKKLRRIHFTREVTGWGEAADFFEALALLCKSSGGDHRVTLNRWKNGDMAKTLCARVNQFTTGDGPARVLLGRWFAHRYALAIRLAGGAVRAFEEHRRRTGRLDFQDLLLLTARLLATRPRVRQELGERYRRVLVDEFQDTDPLQAEILLLLSSEPDEGEGEDGAPDWRRALPRHGALFVVGDPKQSIYRFRRADIQLYGLVKERFRDFGDVLELTTNFRSRPPIGDLVNGLFPCDGYFPARETAEQAAFEPLNTRPPVGAVPAEGVFWYAVAPAADRRDALAADDAARLATWIADRVRAGERAPGDFLVLTRLRTFLDVYARAFEAHGLPVTVTGAGIGVERELRELMALLECMIDPTNPVKVVAVLVGLFFGIDYEKLVEHRLGGGGFDVIRPRDTGQPQVVAALATLRGWWERASREPADVFVGGIASELGLLPFAAAGELGSLRAGALLYALDAVRAATLAGDASLPGALQALRAALDLTEAEAPLEPGRTDAVRLMNLHQAKGLEAEVVVLAEPSGGNPRDPDFHSVRSPDGGAVGYVSVTEGREGYGGDQVLALPSGWDEKAEVERRFQDAEDVRLLYVAATRAKHELVVARWPTAPDRYVSPWKALDSWLLDRGTEIVLTAREPGPRPELELDPSEARVRREAAEALVRERTRPTFRRVTVTEAAKGAERGAPSGATRGSAAQEGFRGFSWGSAVHGALAVAADAPGEDALRAACRDLLVEHERPLDDHGVPKELEELLALVRSVLASELWQRAQGAEQVLAEVPFASVGTVPATDPDPRADAAPPAIGSARRQLDLFGAAVEPAPGRAADELDGEAPAVLEGVIDLAFREADGWVIADYKTDVGTDPDFPARLAAYRAQVELYADAWGRLTGEPVKERVLFFTAQERMERW